MFQRQLTYREAVESALKYNYCNFSGRASRSQFWWFYLFMVLVNFALWFLVLILGHKLGDTVRSLVELALLLPTLGLWVRRLHDVNRSGWWLLIGLTGIGVFLLLYWAVKDSDMYQNQYGPVPNMVA